MELPISGSIGWSLLLQGKADEALREMERGASENWRLYDFSVVYHTLGRRRDSDSALASLKAKYGRELPFLVAEAHAWRDEDDLAFAWLDRAFAARDSYVCDIKLSPAFQRLAGDPRHKAFLRKLKLPE